MELMKKLYALMKEPRVRIALMQTLDALHLWLDEKKTPEETLLELGRIYRVLLL